MMTLKQAMSFLGTISNVSSNPNNVISTVFCRSSGKKRSQIKINTYFFSCLDVSSLVSNQVTLMTEGDLLKGKKRKEWIWFLLRFYFFPQKNVFVSGFRFSQRWSFIKWRKNLSPLCFKISSCKSPIYAKKIFGFMESKLVWYFFPGAVRFLT